MRPFKIQSNLDRAVVNGFHWPLGVTPGSVTSSPQEGYVVGYNQGQDEEPDTYSFRVVVSHERLSRLVERAFELLPHRVGGIVEIGSRDAYRSVDTFLSHDAVDRNDFVHAWKHFEPLLLEDMTIGAGANSDDPYIEVFVDQIKTLSIHVPLSHRDQVEAMLQEEGLVELDSNDGFDGEAIEFRPILELIDEYSPDLDELLLGLRELWELELEVDPDRNLDDGGRELGSTLWNIVAIVYRDASAGAEATGANGMDATDEHPSSGAIALTPEGIIEEAGTEEGAYAIFWLTARSLNEAESLVERSLEQSEWALEEFYSTDRVAYDERPEELADLPPRWIEPKVHSMHIDTWDAAGTSRDSVRDDER